MGQRDLDTFFNNYLKKETIFTDKKILQSNYMPEAISHRDEQINHMANILAPLLKFEKPSNLFLYGKTGTGKTLSIKYITNKLKEVLQKNNNGSSIEFYYLNCKLKRIADTEYRLIAQLAREFGKIIPPTGLPTDEVYKIFFNAIDREKKMVVLILDEIDQLVKKVGDGVLYNLTRINEELKNSQISLVGISNDLVFIDVMDPRVKSSLSEEEVLFPPYNALQLQSILRQRTKRAFKRGSVEEGVIEKCAAYSAREHGDARRALELLRIAGELAEREASSKITLKHLDQAEEKIEKDRILDILTTQPKQFQAVLYSILLIHQKRKDTIFTGEIYELYKGICIQTGLKPLTQRRVGDIITEFDMLGILNVKVISKGRYGRTREINLSSVPLAIPKIKEILEKGLGLA